ncbi:MAG: colanic acid biosynthesis acetyltransferase WcaF [Gemmataceae bacterium]
MTAPAIDPKSRHKSAWTRGQKLRRVLWYLVQATLFRWSFRCYRFRVFLLRSCGATVHSSARIRPSVSIEVPWNLTIAEDVIVGDHAILYCLGPITLKARSMVSQYAHLCAGTHDYTRSDMPLVTAPIVIEEDAWVAADAFVGPGVTVGRGTVLGARASAFRDLPAWKVCVGNPALPIKDRELKQ